MISMLRVITLLYDRIQDRSIGKFFFIVIAIRS
jgi:hypothetical protein